MLLAVDKNGRAGFLNSCVNCKTWNLQAHFRLHTKNCTKPPLLLFLLRFVKYVLKLFNVKLQPYPMHLWFAYLTSSVDIALH